jgi:hypothetical protein
MEVWLYSLEPRRRLHTLPVYTYLLWLDLHARRLFLFLGRLCVSMQC